MLPGPAGVKRSPRPLAAIRGLTSKGRGREGKGREGRRREGEGREKGKGRGNLLQGVRGDRRPCLAESKGSYTAGFMASVTCGLTAEDRDQLRNPIRSFRL